MQRIAHYDITRKLGEGSMGVVFAAKDDRLGRPVAIKLVRNQSRDPNARSRLWREARAAAAVNHPNICQIYDVGEHEGELYIAMEMLEGEALSERIARGPVAAASAVEITASVLDALAALHRANVVHRDLKPTNVFITPHGVKLLDFGLASAVTREDEETMLRLTSPGTVVGTPRYMAPEQWSSSAVGPAADLFACGAILFEMLTGEPAFKGDSIPSVYHSTMHDHPPALVGGSEIEVIDRVINRALAKRPAERYSDAMEMARDLRAVPEHGSGTLSTQPRVRTVTRVIVRPFRLLRPDPEIDFLPDSLADAVTASLCGIQGVVVRSSRLARDSDVDVVLEGSLLKAGGQLRLTAQLIDARDGTVRWSKPISSKASDIFELQDELTAQLLESLSVQLVRRDVPATARAYELYLRALHVGVNAASTSALMTARDLFRESLREDPGFAPALARLGRVYRVIAKYGHDDAGENRALAEEAFRKALEISPDLPVAHFYYTYFEMEEMRDAPRAMARLLGRAQARSADPDLYAGLVAACRFGGLYHASAAADQRARRLDPNIGTSMAYTAWFLRDYQRVAEMIEDSFDYMPWFGRWRLGHTKETIDHLRQFAARVEGRERDMIIAGYSAMEGNREECVAASLRYAEVQMSDPENSYFWAWQLACVGEGDLVLRGLQLAIEGNFCCHSALESEPEFEFLRGNAEFQRLIEEARTRHQHAAAVFREAGGQQVLGITE
ncbi:MAG TPA: protein kinase [Thermoanaerobaculia bacterium]|nr:protein kinase [Thermoanaerobaculia bacterium]